MDTIKHNWVFRSRDESSHFYVYTISQRPIRGGVKTKERERHVKRNMDKRKEERNKKE